MKRLLRFLIQNKRLRAALAWGFVHMNFTIPLHRLVETDTLLAFHHPSPAYPVHILIVPRRAIPSMMYLTPADAAFFNDLYSTVQELVRRFDLDRRGYRLIVNGGAFQDFPQLHFHLVSD